VAEIPFVLDPGTCLRGVLAVQSHSALRLVVGTVGARLEPIPVDYGDMFARQLNDSPVFQIVQGDGDASAAPQASMTRTRG
jgi:hypothetical protein